MIGTHLHFGGLFNTCTKRPILNRHRNFCLVEVGRELPKIRRVLTVKPRKRAKSTETLERSSRRAHSSHAGFGSVCPPTAQVSTALLVSQRSFRWHSKDICRPEQGGKAISVYRSNQIILTSSATRPSSPHGRPRGWRFGSRSGGGFGKDESATWG